MKAGHLPHHQAVVAAVVEVVVLTGVVLQHVQLSGVDVWCIHLRHIHIICSRLGKCLATHWARQDGWTNWTRSIWFSSLSSQTRSERRTERDVRHVQVPETSAGWIPTVPRMFWSWSPARGCICSPRTAESSPWSLCPSDLADLSSPKRQTHRFSRHLRICIRYKNLSAVLANRQLPSHPASRPRS